MSSFNTRMPFPRSWSLTFRNGRRPQRFSGTTRLRDSLYELVQSQTSPRFAVDLAKVDYLSSSGVAILVGLKRRVETKGGQMVIYHLQPIVQDLLGIMKLDQFFTITDDEARAVASLRPLPTA